MKKPRKTGKKNKTPQYSVEPLPGTMMVTGIVGLVISVIYTSGGRIPLDFGVSFIIIFAIILFASLRSLAQLNKP